MGKPGSGLAHDLGVTVEDDVMFGVFSTPDSDDTPTPSNSSALCVYSLQAIRRQFLANIQRCARGVGKRGLDFILPR